MRRCSNFYEGEKKKRKKLYLLIHYLFICSLFNDEVSSLEYTESAAGWLGNNEFGRMWKEAIVPDFRYCY
jgi:hypothetical protein